MLIEMGAVELIEMGKSSLGQIPAQSPVLDIFSVVNYLEDPYKGIVLEPGEFVDPRGRAIAERLRTLSRIQRRGLARDISLSGFKASEIVGESVRLAETLDRLASDPSLGKSKVGKRLKKVGRKVVKVVKSPAFLQVVGLVANLIPGVGPAVSGALNQAAAVRAKKDQAKAEKKEFKKAARAASAMEIQQLDDYYGQNQAVFMFYGYTPSVWSALSKDRKMAVIEKAVAGTLDPIVTPAQADQIVATNPQAQQQVVQTSALSQAVAETYGGQVQGQAVPVSSQLQPQVNQAAVEVKKQIETVGEENFLATLKKAVGQGAAIDSFFKGSGAWLPGGMGDLFSKFDDPKAREAGEQDLKNVGAAMGVQDTVGDLISQGAPSGFPWAPVAAVAGGFFVVGTIIYYVVTRA